MKMITYTIKTITPLHCGVGTGQGDIDLPVAKSPVTGYPIIPGSSLKGVLKNWFLHESNLEKEIVYELFGPENSDFASAISISDSNLLALPVRAFFGGFAYLTGPLAIGLFRQNISQNTDDLPATPTITPGEHYKAMVPAGSLLCGQQDAEQILLEEIDLLLEKDEGDQVQGWSQAIADLFFPEDYKETFKKRFIVADDNVLSFMTQTALPVDAHIAIDPQTGVVKGGALWYEETVPPETLFYGTLSIDNGNKGSSTATELTQALHTNAPTHFQIGGNATTGKGLVELTLHVTSA